MDTTKPAVQIFYGKYLDQITSEIPVSHIDPAKNSGFELTLEPGKPNFPTVDTVKIVLRNMNEAGSELYPPSWFTTNARSVGEGATLPFEIFFRVYVFGEAAFTGIYQEKTYSKNRDDVSVTISSIVGLLEREDRMLKEFSYENILLQSKSAPSDFGSGATLDANSFDIEVLKFELYQEFIETGSLPVADHMVLVKAAIDNFELCKHLQITFDSLGFTYTVSDGSSVTETEEYVFTGYTNISSNTILTRCAVEVYISGGDENPSVGLIACSTEVRIALKVWHGNNTDFDNGYSKVLQVGKFFADDSGNNLSAGSNYSVKLFSFDQGESDAVLKSSDAIIPLSGPYTNPPEFLCGLRYDFTTGNDYEIIDSELGKDHFDVFALTLDSISEFYNHFYNTPANADYFDITNAGSEGRKAFLADASFFNWIGDKNTVKEVLVAMARQTNCYLYTNGMGKVVFQSRKLNEADYLAETVPSGAVDLDANPYQVTAGESEDFGFDTYELEYPADLIEINNLQADNKAKKFVTDSGEVAQPGLRNTKLELSNFRISNMAVPQAAYVDHFGEWRKSPADSSFTGYSASLINEFIKTPDKLATEYAARYTYPTTFLFLALPGQLFPTVAEGGLMHRTNGTKKEIFLVTKITRTSDLLKRVELKKEVEWEVEA